MSRRCAEHFLFTGWLTGSFDLLLTATFLLTNNTVLCGRGLYVSVQITLFSYKNLFYKNVQAEIDQNFKNILKNKPRLRVS